MSRLFNGGVAADCITFSPGNAPPDQGPITQAILTRPSSSSFLGYALQGAAGATSVWALLTFGGKLFIERDFSSGTGAITTDWWWFVATKASGNVPERWHYRNITTGGSWTHVDAAGNVTDGTGPIDSLRLGGAVSGAASDSWRGRIAAAATWTSVLTDLQVEAACTLAATDLLGAAPGWMVRLNQTSTATAVQDDTGGGGNQSALSGTAVDADEPPGWSYALVPSVTPTGLAVPVALGQPYVGTPPTPASLSVPVTLGNPTIGATISTGGTVGSGWWGLKSVMDMNQEYERQERRDPPLACPNDGEPLLRDPRGRLRCPYDGWIWRGYS